MLTHIHHYGIVVRNIDDALVFYKDVLGLPVSVDKVIEEQGVRGVLLPIGGDAEIELLQPVAEGTGIAKFLETRGEGFHHVCFNSTDVAKDLRLAADKEIQLIDETPRNGLAGLIGFLHPKSNHGVLIEYAEPLEKPTIFPNTDALIKSVDHTGIVVSDILLAEKTFTEHFGFALDNNRGGENEALGIKNSFINVAGSALELIVPLVEQGPVAKFSSEHGEGVFLLSFVVDEIDKVVDKLRSEDIRVSDPVGGVAFVHPKFTNGINMQLMVEKES